MKTKLMATTLLGLLTSASIAFAQSNFNAAKFNVEVPFSQATVSCTHVEDAITDTVLNWPGIAQYSIGDGVDPTTHNFGANFCERGLPELMKTAEANGGKLKGVLTVSIRVEKDDNGFRDSQNNPVCVLYQIEEDTFSIGNSTEFSAQFFGPIKRIRDFPMSECMWPQ